MMLELLQIYWPTIIVSIICASSLSLFGGHILARREGLSVFSLSQVISTSILLSMLVFTNESTQLVATVSVTILAATILKYFERQTKLRLDILHLSTFIFFMALNYAISTYFPNLESHLAKSFFGDIVTLSGIKLATLGIMISVCVIAFILLHKRIFAHTFDLALNAGSYRGFNFYQVIQLLVLTICIFNLGLLFTLSFVFLPSAITKNSSRSLRSHYKQCILVSIIGVTAGIMTSLAFDRMATVPTITLATVIFGLCFNVFSSWSNR